MKELLRKISDWWYATRMKIWQIVRLNIFKIPEASLPPIYASAFYWSLFPLSFLSYWIDKRNGRVLERNTWKIYGIEYSDEIFSTFSLAPNEYDDHSVFRLKRDGKYVVIEKITFRNTVEEVIAIDSEIISMTKKGESWKQ